MLVPRTIVYQSSVMKLRIQGNTLRLRLTQPEIDAFRRQGAVQETIRFQPGERLVYSLETSETVSDLRVRYHHGRITVLLPAARVAGWIDTDQVGLSGEQVIEGDQVLTILVEKDFQCLHKTAADQDADAFPHPLAKG